MTEYQLFQYAWSLFCKGCSRETVVERVAQKCGDYALAEEICDYLQGAEALINRDDD